VIEHYLDEANSGENYSTAVRYRDLIFVSGQLGVVPQGEDATFEAQLRTALENLVSAVESLGGDRGTLLKVTGYIADVDYFPVYHALYREILGPGPLPARTTVQVGRFDPPILVEIDAIAATRHDPAGESDQ